MDEDPDSWSKENIIPFYNGYELEYVGEDYDNRYTIIISDLE